MSDKINSRFVGTDRDNSRLVLVLVLAATWSLWPSLASAVPVATTSLAWSCQAGSSTDSGGLSDLPYGQDGACDLSVSIPGGGSATAVAHGNTGFGSGFPFIGNVNGNAEATGGGSAGFNASAKYWFQIQLLKPVPVWPSAGVPVLFSAQGEGYATASGLNAYGNVTAGAEAEGSAYLGGGVGPSQQGFQFGFLDTNTGGFDKTISVNVPVNSDAGVSITAACSAISITGSATCGAAVDPFLGFDQATFDATMGANTFPLNQYFQFVVSENVVPIPPAVWLFGSGLLGLVGIARRTRR